MNKTLMKIESWSKYEDFIIQNIDNIQNDISNKISFSNKPHFYLNYSNNDINTVLI